MTASRRLLFPILGAILLASRLCHTAILWEGDTYPLAAAGQMLHGEMLYRDIWFDKPPLLPLLYLVWGAQPGWPLRLAGALYTLLACWIAYRLARDLWSEREGIWAAGLLGFFLVFDFPAGVIPVASDLMLLVPHLAAVWMAATRRPFWAGVLAGVAFWISPKGLFVTAACVLWDPNGILWMAAGFLSVSSLAVGWLAANHALAPYWEQVWKWGRLYAGSTFLDHPLREGLSRTLNWAGFHATLVVAAARFRAANRAYAWAGWLTLSLAGVAVGLRFFPRYYLLLLPVLVLMAARGFLQFGRRREFVAALLLIPASRFGLTYLTALTNPDWRDIGMDRDSRAAATLLRPLEHPGDTLFVWGYRPELYTYTHLSAGTMFLDSQPLTGVPADRHLTRSDPVEIAAPVLRRAQLALSRPTFVLDGLGLFNPQLAIGKYPDLQQWFSHYREVGRSGQTIVYLRRPD